MGDVSTLRAAMTALGARGSAVGRSPVDALAATLDLRRSVSLADLAVSAAAEAKRCAPPVPSAVQTELAGALPRLDAVERVAMAALARALARRGSRNAAAIRAEIARHLDAARQGMRGVRADVSVALRSASPWWSALDELDVALSEANGARRTVAWTATLDALESELERSTPRLATKIERAARALLQHERASVEALVQSAGASLSIDMATLNTETSAPSEVS